MSNMELVTKEVWQSYVDLNTTHRIFHALVDQSTYTPLRILCYGRQGSGKTTFMYYAVKVAYARYLCHNDGVRKEECLDYAVRTYGLCLGRDCPRDGVDDQLMPGFYVTVDDLLKRFVEDVRSGEIAKRRVVFFDDAFTPRTWWNLGGKWRELYHMAKNFDQFYRDHVDVLILTAPTLNYFTKEYIKNSLILAFDAKILNGRPYVLAVHFKYPHFTKHLPDYYYHMVRVKQLDFVDKVPFRKAYGLPRWLEKLNTERRQYVLREAAERALEAFRKYQEISRAN